MTKIDQTHASPQLRTLFFEKQTGLSIANFNNTDQVDKVVESRIGNALPISRLGEASRIVSTKGNIFRIKRYNIEDIIDRELSR
jgi:hypothetical protein